MEDKKKGGRNRGGKKQGGGKKECNLTVILKFSFLLSDLSECSLGSIQEIETGGLGTISVARC